MNSPTSRTAHSALWHRCTTDSCTTWRFTRPEHSMAGHCARVWAVPGPSEAAQQRPRTTNDDHQEREPTAPDQRKHRSPRSLARPRARRSRFRDHAPELRGRRGSGASSWPGIRVPSGRASVSGQAVETAHWPRSAVVGPAVVGRTSKSKMAVGRYSEQQALGMSTIPLMRPSMGAAPRIR